MRIDWFAVDCVLGGTSLPLNAEERKAVVRRVQHRLLPYGLNEDGIHISIRTLADRMGCTERAVSHIQMKLPPADKLVCDVCNCEMWVRRDDVIEPHSDYLFKQCPMSGTPFEADWESELAHRAVWLAGRLRAGDPHGVWEYVERLRLSSVRRLLVAALAGMDEAEDPYQWLQEVG